MVLGDNTNLRRLRFTPRLVAVTESGSNSDVFPDHAEIEVYNAIMNYLDVTVNPPDWFDLVDVARNRLIQVYGRGWPNRAFTDIIHDAVNDHRPIRLRNLIASAKARYQRGEAINPRMMAPEYLTNYNNTWYQNILP